MSDSGARTEAEVSVRRDPLSPAGTWTRPGSLPQVRSDPTPAVAALFVVAGLALGYGLVLRLWLLVQLPIWGDEAIVGIMARAIDGGHFTALYWGQRYGGLEPYLVALGLKVGGGGEHALNGTPAVLSALAGVLAGTVVWAAVRNRPLAVAAAAAVWVWPYVTIWQSVREGGFRQATLCCGLAAVVCCVGVYRRRAGPRTFLALGVALGLGWWASPEIGYFAMPCLVLFAAWWWSARHPSRLSGRDDGRREPSRTMAVGLTLGGILLGSLPWLYTNAHTGFASLKSSSFPANGGATYTDRFSTFFHSMLPLQLGVRTLVTGSWVGGPLVGRTLYVLLLALIAGAIIEAFWLGIRGQALVPFALACGVVSYPFLYAAIPGTNYWNDGRYGIFLPPLLVVLFVAVLGTPRTATDIRVGDGAADGRRPGVGRSARPAWSGSGRPAVASLGLLGALCLTVAGARSAGVPVAFFASWHNGDAPLEQVVHDMREHNITSAYGDYWTAYDLDFLSEGSPAISPSPFDVVRASALASQLAASRDPAWLFFAPNQTAAATSAFANPQPGPGPYTEQTFEAHLSQLGIPYNVVKLGILDAVVPQHRVPIP